MQYVILITCPTAFYMVGDHIVNMQYASAVQVDKTS